MWEIYRQDMISYSGISIFLLGNKKEGETTVLSNGMRSEYEISKKQGNFLIPLVEQDIYQKCYGMSC